MINGRNVLLSAAIASLLYASAIPAWGLDPGKPPGQNFDLSHWKLTLPVDSLGGTNGTAAEVSASQLTAGYTNAAYFYTGADGAMDFICPATGAVTPGASHPRTELREMLNPSSSSADWNPSGVHVLAAQCRATAVSTNARFAIGQVHGYSINIPLVILRYNNTQNPGFVEATVKYNTAGTNVNGATDSVLEFSNVGLNDPIDYQIMVSNGVAFITVNGQTQSQDFYATDTNWANVSFYFKAGDYYIDNAGTTNSAQVSFDALSARHGPAITNPPADLAVDAGDEATFTAGAVGNGSLSYQWYFNATNKLFSATQASLTIPNAQATNAGDYSVAISDSLGSSTSAVAVLTVNPQSSGGGASYQWDADTNSAGVQDGPGIWKANTSADAFWTTNNGVSDTLWPATNAEAVFGGGDSGVAGTILLPNATPPVIDALTFNTPFAGDYALTNDPGPGGPQLADGTTITVNGGNPAIDSPMGGVDAGAGFTKLGSGTLWLGAANTFQGVMRISQGTVVIGADNAMGAYGVSLLADELTLDGGTLSVTNGFTWGNYRGIYLTSNGGTIDVAAGQTVTIGGGSSAPITISGQPGGNLVKAGPGAFSIQIYSANPNTYSGETIVNGGTLALQGNSNTRVIGDGGLWINTGAVVSVASGKSGLIANGASLTNMGGTYIAGGNETNGYLVLGGDGVLTNGSTSSRTFWVTNTIELQSGTIVGNGSPIPNNRLYLAGPATLLKTTPGTAYIVGTNSTQVHNYQLTGKTILIEGILNIGLDDALGIPGSFAADQLTMDGGTLQIDNAYSWNANRGVTLTSNGGTFDIASGQSQTVPVVIAGTAGGVLTKVGGGTLKLTAANTYNGANTIIEGTLLVNGSVAGDATISGGAKLGGLGTVGGNASFATGAQAYLYKISGSGDTPLAVTGALTLNDNAVNVDLGGTTLDVGVYRLLNYSGAKTGSFNPTPIIVNGATTRPASIDQTTAHQINLVVAAAGPPAIGSVIRSGSNLILSGTGGTAGGEYYVLLSTNLALPLSNWTSIATNVFDGSGGFSLTNPINLAEPQQFWILKEP
jgi:autotransporter-associated beta strand protein